MKQKRAFTVRYVSLAAFFILVCLIYTVRLIQIQIAGQDYYVMTTGGEYRYRTETRFGFLHRYAAPAHR